MNLRERKLELDVNDWKEKTDRKMCNYMKISKG